MIEATILFALAAAGILWWRHRRRRPAPPPADTEYVCHFCGEHDCICHRKKP